MPVSQLDEKAALIVIDLQKRIVGFPMAHSAGEIVERSAKIAKAFRERGLPVVLVHGRTQAGTPHFELPPDFAEIVPDMGHEAGDHVVTKQRFGAFHGTDLDGI